jgi:hypothetical protein
MGILRNSAAYIGRALVLWTGHCMAGFGLEVDSHRKPRSTSILYSMLAKNATLARKNHEQLLVRQPGSVGQVHRDQLVLASR